MQYKYIPVYNKSITITRTQKVKGYPQINPTNTPHYYYYCARPSLFTFSLSFSDLVFGLECYIAMLVTRYLCI